MPNVMTVGLFHLFWLNQVRLALKHTFVSECEEPLNVEWLPITTVPPIMSMYPTVSEKNIDTAIVVNLL